MIYPAKELKAKLNNLILTEINGELAFLGDSKDWNKAELELQTEQCL